MITRMAVNPATSPGLEGEKGGEREALNLVLNHLFYCMHCHDMLAVYVFFLMMQLTQVREGEMEGERGVKAI